MGADTFSEDELRRLHEEVLEAMLKAGWLLNYTFTVGKGWHLGWTEEGTQRAVLLKEIATNHRLQHDDRAPMCFDKLTRGESLPSFCRPVEIDDAISTFWRESVDSLQLPRDEDHLIIFVGAIVTWAPDEKTPIRFIRE